MLSMLFKMVGWEGDRFSKEFIDMEEIKEVLAGKNEWEEKIHYGRVTEVRVDHSLVDGVFWMAGQSVARIGGGEAREGERVCVKLGRETEGGGEQWRVRELLQVMREGGWDAEEQEECNEDKDISGSMHVTKVCCIVKRVSGGRVTIKMPGGEEKMFSLSEVWEESFLPVSGDMIQVSFRLVIEDLEDFEGSKVVTVKPSRVLQSDGIVVRWDLSRGEGLVRGDVWLHSSACPHGYRPRMGDSVSMVAVECVPSPQVWDCGWRATRAAPREGRQLHSQAGVRREEGWLVRGQSRSYSRSPSFKSYKLPEYPVPPSLLDPLLPSPALLYPQLTEPLSPHNFKSKLHTLLHLESVSAQHSLTRYSMTNQALTRSGPFLSLSVPGLQEGRPSLVQGDSVILSTPGVEGPQYEGCIHEVRGNFLMLKFSTQFQLTYCGETYDITYLRSRTQVRRQHRAVEMAEAQLGWYVVFPSKIEIKEPKVVVVDPDCQKVKRNLSDSLSKERSRNKVKCIGRPFQKLKWGSDVRDENKNYMIEISGKSDMVEEFHDDVEGINGSGDISLKVIRLEVRNKILARLSTTSPILSPPHPVVKPIRMSETGPDALRRKVLLSTLPAPSLDLSVPLWSAPCFQQLAQASPPPTLLSALPHSFSPPISPSLTPYYPLPLTDSPLSWFNTNLNPEQRSAVLNILAGRARPLPYILYGPPGTGKTVTLVEAILQTFILRGDSRILVCTPSNSSADLITARLIQSGKIVYGDLARLNAFQRSSDSVPEIIRAFCFVPEEEGAQLDSAAKHRVVVTTCSTAGTLYKLCLRPGHFSHIFVDEAGHVTEPEVLVALCLLNSSVGQLVLAGDHQQLGPILNSTTASIYGLEQSFLERLANMPIYLKDKAKFGDHGGYDPVLLTKLVRNYRSHEDIIHIPSKLFYSGELVACSTTRMRNRFCGDTLGCLLPAIKHPVVFHGVSGDNFHDQGCTSWHNPQEVWQVVRYVQQLLVRGVLAKEIGVIAPYRAQGAKVRDMLTTLGVDWEGLKVGSVEEFQGQERAVIILTTVRSKVIDSILGGGAHGLGFLSSKKRFNVAITRAQSLLVVVGDPHLLCRNEVWLDFISFVVEFGGYTGCDKPLCLQSELSVNTLELTSVI